jgi:hypothetical protein
MIAANPEASRPDWVKPNTFRDGLAAMLDSLGMLSHLRLPGRCKTSLISAVVTAKPGRRAERIQVPATSAHTVRGSYSRPQLLRKSKNGGDQRFLVGLVPEAMWVVVDSEFSRTWTAMGV